MMDQILIINKIAQHHKVHGAKRAHQRNYVAAGCELLIGLCAMLDIATRPDPTMKSDDTLVLMINFGGFGCAMGISKVYQKRIAAAEVVQADAVKLIAKDLTEKTTFIADKMPSLYKKPILW